MAYTVARTAVTVSQQKRKQRKRWFGAPSHIKAKLMSSNLSKELREKFGVRAMPIRKNDEVKIMSGKFKNKEGKVKRVFRKSFKIYVQGLTQDKVNHTAVDFPFHPSKVQIKKLYLNKDRKKLIQQRAKKSTEKGKITEKEVAKQ